MLFDGALVPALLTWAALLVGIGWYGSIPNPPIASDFLQHIINNSVVATTLSSLLIPANAVTGLQILTYELTGNIQQATGVNQNTPGIVIQIGGFQVFSGPIVTVLPNSANLYWFRFTMLIYPTNGSITALDAYTWF